jgi:hypothetical protein
MEKKSRFQFVEKQNSNDVFFKNNVLPEYLLSEVELAMVRGGADGYTMILDSTQSTDPNKR